MFPLASSIVATPELSSIHALVGDCDGTWYLRGRDIVVDRTGTAGFILATMKTWLSNGDFQLTAARILRNLLWLRPSDIGVLLKGHGLGVLGVLSAASDAHVARCDVQQNLYMVLEAIARFSKDGAAMMEKDARASKIALRAMVYDVAPAQDRTDERRHGPMFETPVSSDMFDAYRCALQAAAALASSGFLVGSVGSGSRCFDSVSCIEVDITLKAPRV